MPRRLHGAPFPFFPFEIVQNKNNTVILLKMFNFMTFWRSVHLPHAQLFTVTEILIRGARPFEATVFHFIYFQTCVHGCYFTHQSVIWCVIFWSSFKIVKMNLCLCSGCFSSAVLVGNSWNRKRQIVFVQGLVELWGLFVTGSDPLCFPFALPPLCFPSLIISS